MTWSAWRCSLVHGRPCVTIWRVLSTRSSETVICKDSAKQRNPLPRLILHRENKGSQSTVFRLIVPQLFTSTAGVAVNFSRLKIPLEIVTLQPTVSNFKPSSSTFRELKYPSSICFHVFAFHVCSTQLFSFIKSQVAQARLGTVNMTLHNSVIIRGVLDQCLGTGVPPRVWNPDPV